MSLNQKGQYKCTKEKTTPAYLDDDYPYRTVGEFIKGLDSLKSVGALYEIRCPECEMSIRAQGDKVKHTYDRLTDDNGCIGCSNKNLEVRIVDMSRDK